MNNDRPLLQISPTEVRIDFKLNTKCRANITLTSLSSTVSTAFKVQTSSPHKFLVNPPTGLISPSSCIAFQIILKPQTQLPPTFPRSKSDRFLIKTAPFNHQDQCDPSSLNSFFSAPNIAYKSFKLKVAFVGPFLLHHAVSSGDIVSAKSLIKRQKSLLTELSPTEAESLLRVACELDHPENMVNLLLEAGLKIDARVRSNHGFYEVGNTWRSEGWIELHAAVAFDRTKEVLNLVERLEPLDLRDGEGRTALHLAVIRGNVRCAKELVEWGADVDAQSKDGRTVLHRAVVEGDRRMVDFLIEMGADPTIRDDHGSSAFDVARGKGHEMVEILEQGERLLKAAMQGDLKLVEALLHKGANVKYSDQYGLTPLHASAIKGHEKIVSMLVEFGAQVECQDSEGHTPLHLAVLGGNLGTVEVLVSKGANIIALNNQGATPPHLANVIGYNEIAQFLNDRGASTSSLPFPQIAFGP